MQIIENSFDTVCATLACATEIDALEYATVALEALFE